MKTLFDLDAVYSHKFIIQLLKIKPKKCAKYLDSKGCLTEKGREVIEALNKIYADEKYHE